MPLVLFSPPLAALWHRHVGGARGARGPPVLAGGHQPPLRARLLCPGIAAAAAYNLRGLPPHRPTQASITSSNGSRTAGLVAVQIDVSPRRLALRGGGEGGGGSGSGGHTGASSSSSPRHSAHGAPSRLLPPLWGGGAGLASPPGADAGEEACPCMHRASIHMPRAPPEPSSGSATGSQSAPAATLRAAPPGAAAAPPLC